MELASNLIWAVVTLVIVCSAWRAARRGTTGLSTSSTILLALLICILLLPVVSISDDILASQQAALPFPAQTWRLATEGVSVGVEILPLLGMLLLLLAYRAGKAQRLDASVWSIRPQIIWLTRSLRLRPPPAAAL